jgi:metal transporter CNNM
VAYPTAKLLDYSLGSDEGGNHYKKAELKSFLQFHRHGQEPLRDDEITILDGVLSLNERSVDAIMTPMKVGTSSDIIHTNITTVKWLNRTW